jgi:hypothetical protein
VSELPHSTIDVRRTATPSGGVFADFVVNGLSLLTRARRKAEIMGCLGWGDSDAQDAAVARLPEPEVGCCAWPRIDEECAGPTTIAVAARSPPDPAWHAVPRRTAIVLSIRGG